MTDSGKCERDCENGYNMISWTDASDTKKALYEALTPVVLTS